jgi:hypothetical protein
MGLNSSHTINDSPDAETTIHPTEINVAVKLYDFQRGALPDLGYYYSKTITISIHPDKLVKELLQLIKNEIDPKDDCDLSYYLGGIEKNLEPEMKVKDVFTQKSIFLRVDIPYNRRLTDIGYFSFETESEGANFLTQSPNNLNHFDASDLIDKLHGNHNAIFISLPQILSSQECKQLREKVDYSFNEAGVNARGDYKLVLTENELENLLGESKVHEMKMKFRVTVDEIILRRCTVQNKFIKFHLDHSFQTMQVAFLLILCLFNLCFNLILFQQDSFE